MTSQYKRILKSGRGSKNKEFIESKYTQLHITKDGSDKETFSSEFIKILAPEHYYKTRYIKKRMGEDIVI